MSGVVNAITKPFKRLREKNKLLGTLAIAAAAWWASGVAYSAFAAPAGTSASTILSSPWTSAAGFAEQAAGVSGAGSGVQVGTLAAEAPTTATALPATAAGQTAAGGVLEPVSASGINLGVGAGDVVGSTATNAAASKGIIGGVGDWITKNPLQTMILGQGVMGAYQGHLADKERQREDDWRRSRGLMGVDFNGNYAGQPRGIVGAPVQQQTTAQAVGGPAPSTVQGPQAPATRAIPRSKLPDLQLSGLLNPYGGQ